MLINKKHKQKTHTKQYGTSSFSFFGKQDLIVHALLKYFDQKVNVQFMIISIKKICCYYQKINVLHDHQVCLMYFVKPFKDLGHFIFHIFLSLLSFPPSSSLLFL